MKKRRFLAVIARCLVCCLLLASAGCSSPAASDPKLTDVAPDAALSDVALAETAGDTASADTLATCQATPGCACNGHPALCDRRLDEVVFPSAHNAMSNADEGWLFANHNYGLTRQLNDGVRGFLLDTHSWENPEDKSTTAWLCHSSCQLGSIRLVDALTKFTTFLSAHPDEVLIFIVQDDLPTAEFVAAMTTSGLLPYAMTQPKGAKFPTLRALIASGKRLLVTTEQTGGPPAWIHRFNDLGFDTPYTFKTMAALRTAEGPEDSCRKYRGTAGAPLFLMNHWVAQVLPAAKWSEQANVRTVLVDRAKRCAKLHGRLPTLVAVDHYDLGDLFGAVRELNGL